DAGAEAGEEPIEVAIAIEVAQVSCGSVAADGFDSHLLRTVGETDLQPVELHELGLAEVQRIRSEMIATIRITPFYQAHPELHGVEDDKLFDAFQSYLRESPEFRCENAEDVLRRYRDIAKRVDHWLPSMFSTLPRLPFGIVSNPSTGLEGGLVAYRQGDLERGVASVMTVDTSDLAAHTTYVMIPFAMHEGVPGHHLQIAYAAENEKLSAFRRRVWFTAFGEGWALYAEKLGIAMGLYSDAYDRFGLLQSEMHRACRLVVDPGIHALGWTKEQAAEFLKQHTLFSDAVIDLQVNRYIAWPAQAVAYKVGEIRILQLRARAEAELGAAFDLRKFHEVVLADGAMPLAVLERRINAWIDSNRRSGE
ncbi:MAG: DUF885 domain-containing protein, partial [Phycisphaerales bacterium]|nr:DUF885 domain-containing protein [Phycisphaerales bacterium]